MNSFAFFKGWHYKSPFIYDVCDLLKRGLSWRQRYFVAQRYILDEGAVLDLCSGAGSLKSFLVRDRDYFALDASPGFLASAGFRGAHCICHDLHQGLPPGLPQVGTAVMIISLAQFRKTSIRQILERLKQVGRRVVIVEEVLEKTRDEHGLWQRCVNHLCQTSYYVPVTWFTRLEFKALMQQYGYRCEDAGGSYVVAIFEEAG